jgi:hypothetical protein
MGKGWSFAFRDLVLLNHLGQSRRKSCPCGADSDPIALFRADSGDVKPFLRE